MDPLQSLMVGLVVGALLGGLLTILVSQRRRSARPGVEDPAVVEARHQLALAELRAGEAEAQSLLREELAAVMATMDGLRGQVSAAGQQYCDLVDRQRTDQEARSERERQESRVLQALAPVRESLQDMQRKVSELEAQRSLQHGELSQQLRSATESEERLRGTAESLASALRANSTRGVWGETQLRSVVEAAGLIERVDFDVQSQHHLGCRRRPARHGHPPSRRQEHRRRREGAVHGLTSRRARSPRRRPGWRARSAPRS